MAMSREDRAKQFAPFDALRGLREALKRKEEEKERCERKELSEEMLSELEGVLSELSAGDLAEITFYHEGKYVRLRGRVKRIDPVRRQLEVEEGKIPFRDLFSVKILT